MDKFSPTHGMVHIFREQVHMGSISVGTPDLKVAEHVSAALTLAELVRYGKVQVVPGTDDDPVARADSCADALIACATLFTSPGAIPQRDPAKKAWMEQDLEWDL